VASPDRGPALKYTGIAVLSQVVVAIGFWVQITNPQLAGGSLGYVIAITVLFELLTIYCLFRLYQFRYQA
jgi:hypothetical protein